MDFIIHTLIIGGGPSGATLARELSKKNVENILIEKNLSFDKPCGGGIKSHVFEEFDIPKIFESKKINSINLYSPKNKSVVDISNSPLSIVLRKEFDAKLRSLAQEDGTKLIEGRFIKADYFSDHVISTIKVNNDFITIKSKYLVAADGVKSSVKKDLLKTYPSSVLTNYTLVKNNNFTTCEFYFGKKVSPNQYAWVFPHGKELSIGSVLQNNESKFFFEKLKKEQTKDSNEKLKTKGYYIPVWQEETTFYKNQVFFLGDCAQQVLPFTYEGIYYVMRSARILSNAIIKEDPSLYEKEWKETFQRRFKFFKIMQKIFLSSDFMTNKMISFFNNKNLRQSALSYWKGNKKPLTLLEIISKGSKLLLKK